MTDPTEPTTVLESLQEASAPQTQAVNDPREPAAHNTPDAPGAVHLPIEAQVQAFVEQWARDWSQKNVGAYLEAYAADFKPEGGKSVAAWAEERKQRILSKKSISVQIQSLGIVSASDMGVTVAFVQVYAADQLVSTTQKTLLLGQREGRLRILREFTP